MQDQATVTSPMLENTQDFCKRFESIPYLSSTAYERAFETRATQQIEFSLRKKTFCLLPIVFLTANKAELGRKRSVILPSLRKFPPARPMLESRRSEEMKQRYCTTLVFNTRPNWRAVIPTWWRKGGSHYTKIISYLSIKISDLLLN